MADVISVSELNRYVKMLLDVNDGLFDLALRGEIANFVQNARSGHCYFSLRDEACQRKSSDVPHRCAAVWHFARRRGCGWWYAAALPSTSGTARFRSMSMKCSRTVLARHSLRLEQLKARLEKEGLFDPAHKKPLPVYPKCIGVVTSKTGAALQDIRNVISRRWPSVRLLLCPVTVQGFEAARQIAAAIRTLDQSGKVDEIIVARGGGSGRICGCSTPRRSPGQHFAAKHR